MKRFFIEVAYIGTHYSGFQVQQNASTIHGEIEKALAIIHKQPVQLTGSSRTDAGVHALQNFFHVDIEADTLGKAGKSFQDYVYNLNALLPIDIVIKSIRQVHTSAHSRFSATNRSYKYTIAAQKDPFIYNRSYFFPYSLDVELLNEAAAFIKEQTFFEAFSKKHTQVLNFNCTIYESRWLHDKGGVGHTYHVSGNRFLRGMVKALTGTMLRVGTGSISIDEFRTIFIENNARLVDFSPPGKGLTLVSVKYPDELYI
jgi:tRNA pseudouridine38-40 synthase